MIHYQRLHRNTQMLRLKDKTYLTFHGHFLSFNLIMWPPPPRKCLTLNKVWTLHRGFLKPFLSELPRSRSSVCESFKLHLSARMWRYQTCVCVRRTAEYTASGQVSGLNSSGLGKVVLTESVIHRSILPTRSASRSWDLWSGWRGAAPRHTFPPAQRKPRVFSHFASWNGQEAAGKILYNQAIAGRVRQLKRHKHPWSVGWG